MRGSFGALLIGLTLVLSAPVMAAAQTPVQVPTLPVEPPAVELPSLPVPLPTVAPAPVPVPQVAPPPVPMPSIQSPTSPAPSSGSAPSPSQGLPGSAPSAAAGSWGRVRDTALNSGGGTSSQATASTLRAGTSGSFPSGGTAMASKGAQRAAERRRSARERRFRRTVRRLQPCLSALPTLARRVLVLRAGLGEQEVLTVAQTARRVKRRQQTVRRIERWAVRKLKVAVEQGDCTGGSAAIAPDGMGTAAPLAQVAGGEFPDVGGPPGRPSAAVGNLGGAGSSGAGTDRRASKGRGVVKGEQREKNSGSLDVPGSLVSPEAKDVTVPLLILLALGGFFWLTVAWTRRRGRG